MSTNFYIFNINKKILTYFNNLKFNKYFISNYEIPICQGIVTENIFERLITTPLQTISISKNAENTNKIYGIIIHPNLNEISVNFETFIMLNFYNKEYIKNILNITNYFDIFDQTKIIGLRNYFNKKYTTIEVLNINNSFNKLINSKLPFNHIILDISNIPNFINQVNNIDNIDNINWLKPSINIINETNSTIDLSNCISNNINYILSEISYGIGDFIQRYQNHLLKLFNYSTDNFILINNKKYSYINKVHNSCKYFGMYHFPGFNFAIKNDNIDTNKITNINYNTLIELLVYNKSFFYDFDNNFFLLINLSSTPGQGLSNNINYNYCSKIYKQKILRENIQLSYSQINWNFEKFSDNEIIILHFRRSDYLGNILNGKEANRTMNTFDYMLDIATRKLNSRNIKNIDAVIISDHYNIDNIPKSKHKFVPILFDYNFVSINDSFTKNNVTLTIKDKVIGENNETNEYKILKYLANCKYKIGNMSCFPHIIANIFNHNLIDFSRDVVPPNIRAYEDLEYLLNNNDYFTPSYKKYK